MDVTGATDVIPDGDPKLDGEAKLGGGPIVNRGSTINPKGLPGCSSQTAEAEGIGYTVNVSAGDTLHRHGRRLLRKAAPGSRRA